MFSEVVSISNLGVARFGPLVEESGSLLLEYENGSACTTSDGMQTTYTTRIHLVCSRGSLVRRSAGRGSAGSPVAIPPGVSLNGGERVWWVEESGSLFQKRGLELKLGFGSQLHPSLLARPQVLRGNSIQAFRAGTVRTHLVIG